MEFKKMTCEEFIDVLASKEPVPGGGGASALVGAVGTALGNMVGSLTVGKKKYAPVEEEIRACMESCKVLERELLDLMDRDAEVFAPLARAYSLPSSTEEEKRVKEEIMAEALDGACRVPLEIMEKCCEAITLVEVFAEKGSVMALSDAGVAAAFCRAALEGASLNVFINTKSMKNRERAKAYEEKADAMLSTYPQRADAVLRKVQERLRG